MRGGVHFRYGVSRLVHGDVLGQLREPVKAGVGKLAGGRSGVVQDVEIELAVVLPNPGAPPDDLLELAHGVNDAHDDDVFAGRRVYPGGEQLGGGENDRRGGFQLLKPAQVAASDPAFVGGHTGDVVRILFDQILIEVRQRPAHFIGVFLVYAKHNGFRKAVGALHELSEVVSNGVGAGAKRHDPFKILGAVFPVRDFPPVAVKLALGRSPAARVHGGNYSMHAVGGEKAVLDPLLEAVGVERFPKVAVSVAVILPQRRRGHPQLVGWLKILQYLPPVALVAGAASVALVHHDQIKEVAGVLPIQAGAAFILSERLVDGEIHLAAFANLAAFDLEPGLAKRGKGLVLGIVHQNVAVGQKQDAGFAVFAGAIPAGVPQFPTDLKRHHGFPGARRHREQHAALALQDRLHGAVDGDLLVVAGLDADQVSRSQQPRGGLLAELLGGHEALPQFVGRRKTGQLPLLAGGVVEFQDGMTIGGIGELHPQNLGIVLRLLHSGSGWVGLGLGLHYGDHEVAGVVEHVIGPLLLPPNRLTARGEHPSIGKDLLLVDRVGSGLPLGGLQLGRDIDSARIGFVQGHGTLEKGIIRCSVSIYHIEYQKKFILSLLFPGPWFTKYIIKFIL